jgi:predicted metal-dependent phosphoesterase TrpH
MTIARTLAWVLVVVATIEGTWRDTSPPRGALVLGGRRVVVCDFHVHPFPLSAATLAPWDLVLEARRQGLDAIAITPHNGAFAGKVGRWFAEFAGGPTVIPGEEIHGPRFHLIAAGTSTPISWRLSAGEAIDEIHRQGGIAIAAHPTAASWAAYDLATERKLDGAEVLQPTAYARQSLAEDLRGFYARAPLAAIGSSDFHGLGPLGVCRTYVFARDDSAAAILEAIRAHRTVVVDGERVFGDPALVGYAPQLPAAPARPSPWGAVCALAGLVGLVVLPREAAELR